MKKIFSIIVMFAGFAIANGQSNCLLNGDFASLNSGCGSLCSQASIEGDCIANWFPVSGSPQVFGSSGSVWNYAYMWAFNDYDPRTGTHFSNESMFSKFSFRQNVTYTIAIRVAGYSSAGNPTTQDFFNVYLTNGLTATGTGGCTGMPNLTSSFSQGVFANQSGSTFSQSYTTLTTTVTPNRDYSQLYIFPYTSALSRQFNLLVEYVYVYCGDQCSGNMFITSATIPTGESKAADIIAGSQNSGTVVNNSSANTILKGSSSVQLVQNLNVTISGSNYFQAKIEGCSAQSISNETISYDPFYIDSSEERAFIPVGSLEDVSNAKLYPNPARNLLTIVFNNETVNPKDIMLFNSMGQRIVIDFISLVAHEGSVVLDVKKLPPGMYFLKTSKARFRPFLKI
jgi:hypothetical protein